MLSLIEVQCPHCGARGQIMIPPVGAIIIGPCPQCEELVVVFCGHVLPLDKSIMEDGSVDDRKEHLLGVLTEFLQDRIYRLLDEDMMLENEDETDMLEGGPPDDAAPPSGDEQRKESPAPISQGELERFADVDLKLLDNKAYFKSVFEQE